MNNVYESPLSSRYASKEMLYNFSSDMKFSTWRRLWVSLAKAEMALGLPITQEQVDEMEAHITDIDYDVARQREKEVRHDVMAHVYTFGKVAPKAAGIIHLGATSAYVGDNTDIIQIREGLLLVRKKLATVLDKLAQFADAHKAQPTLGFTHFQPAQLTTVGKRATLWMNELLMDLGEVEYRIENLRMLGSKGTTGTQASFMELFDGDESKVKELEKRIADDFGFAGVVPVSGQTYSRKIDAQTLATLAGIAESASKFACSSTSRRSRSRSRRTRSVPLPCRTSAIRCAPSVSAHSRATLSPTASTRRSPPRPSGSSARSTTPRTSASRFPKRSSRSTLSSAS